MYINSSFFKSTIMIQKIIFVKINIKKFTVWFARRILFIILYTFISILACTISIIITKCFTCEVTYFFLLLFTFSSFKVIVTSTGTRIFFLFINLWIANLLTIIQRRKRTMNWFALCFLFIWVLSNF